MFHSDVMEDAEFQIEFPGVEFSTGDNQFPSRNPLDMPDILPCRVALPDSLESYYPKTEHPGPYLWGYGGDSLPGELRQKTICHFYTADERWGQVWSKSEQFLKKITDDPFLAMVSPNFSTWWDIPEALQVYNIYRNRWVCRYWQENGIPVIPDVPVIPCKSHWCYAGVPRHGLISQQWQVGVTATKENVAKRIEAFHDMLCYVDPAAILVYGSERGLELLVQTCPDGIKIIPVICRSSAYLSGLRKPEQKKGGETELWPRKQPPRNPAAESPEARRKPSPPGNNRRR